MIKKVLWLLLLITMLFAVDLSASEYIQFGESTNYNYYIEEEAVNIMVESKNTGESYESVVEDASMLSGSWQQMALSGITIEYTDNKNNVKQISSNNSKVKKTFTYGENTVKVSLDFTKAKIKFDVILTVEEDSLVVTVPAESIVEVPEEFRLVSIYLFPFFGSNSNRESTGYMFIPDGSGGIIRYDQTDVDYYYAYIQPIYGKDMGYQNPKTYNDTLINVTYPVYGIVHEENQMGFWAHIDSGAENAEIVAYPAGLITPYFWNTQHFIYRELYFNQVNKKGAGEYEYPDEILVYDAQVTYNFQEQANYSTFANGYNEYLLENQLIGPTRPEDSQPFLVTFLGLEDSTATLLSQDMILTSFEDVTNIIADLQSSGITPTVIIEGWNKNGYTNQEYDSEISRKFGSQQEMEAYIAENPEIDMYLSGNTTVTNEEELYDETGTYVTTMFDLFNWKYVVDPETAINATVENSNETIPYAYNDIFSFLYSSTTKSRTEILTQIESMDVEQSAVGTPNEYAYKYTEIYYGMNPSSNGYSIVSEDVPFLQMALSGSITMYSEPLNLIPTNEVVFLKLVEYNIYPNYYITQNDPYMLLDSNLEGVYSSEYELFKDQMVILYDFYTPFYEATNGAAYISHDMIGEVAVCQYSNGTTVYVNYSDVEQTVDGVTISPASYEVAK